MAENTKNYTDLEDQAAIYTKRRNQQLTDKKIERKIIQQAWFTLSHMLLSEGALVADIGCDEGAMTYAMAVLYPQVNFVGIDKDKRKINKAKITYKLDNLRFKHADASKQFDDDGTYDAIVNSYVLHEMYSASKYNERIIRDVLTAHFKMIKKNGLMFIQDYARPPPEQFVLMEMPDKPSKGKDPSQMSEADLLVWYSEHARPRHDSGTGGFFLDELPERVPGTRLFRLPYKWAYEFVMRKDDRLHWDKELPIEYTFYTQQEFRKEIRNVGARASYTAPHWNEEYIEEHFRESFRMMRDDGTPMGYPATSFVTVARNMAERKSLIIHERRPHHKEESKLKITAMRDSVNGAVVDVVSREEEISEIIPYRVDKETGRLKIYLHDGVPRSITNSVPRNGVSIDDRRWSGHMLEPIAVDSESLNKEQEEFDLKETVHFAREYLGLKPANGQTLKKGPEYFPAPDFIDDLIHTYYLEVNQAKGDITPKASLVGHEKFHEKGAIREVDAQQVLDAITVGKIPSARLELQILYLFNHLEIHSENWGQKQVAWKVGEIKQKTHLKDVLANYGIEDKRFKAVKGTAGQLRPIHSIFVEEGQSKGNIAGLSSKELDFVVHNDETINTAVILPLSKGLQDDVHAGFTLKQMPIPQRHSGNANIISAPSFNLPREVTNIKLAKEYLAEQFGVLPEMLIKLGESYFSHIGMTQQKIHPFAVIIPEGKPEDPNTEFLPFYQFMLLRRNLAKDTHFMIVLARAYRYLHEDIRLDFDRRVGAIVKERFEQAKPDWSLPLNFEASPIRKERLERIDKEIELAESKNENTAAPKKKAKKAEAEAKKQEAKETPEVSTDTDVKLSEEFEHEFAEFVETLEQDLPKATFER